MTDTIIEVENLGKRYVLDHQQEREKYTALRDVIARGVKSALKGFGGKKTETKEEFWALKDVSFQVKRGEVVGIIGRNGAGKSTLLKILSRITEPTTGRVRLKGRVASLLEVGTGFHPELTGRENIYLNGAVLGMMRQEIDRKFDEIVAFAEVEKFLDTPVKRYSSGMYVRLAFAVAAHLEPEILVVDEVLAVGDAAFQKKCLGKMGDVASKEGRTVLFVSHNMATVTTICQRAIWLVNGQINLDGNTEKVTSKYLTYDSESSGEILITNRGHNRLYFQRIALIDSKGNVSAVFDVRESIKIQLEYEVLQDIKGLEIGFRVINSSGIIVFTVHRSSCLSFQLLKGSYCAEIEIPSFFLVPGCYSLDVASHIPNVEVLCLHQSLMSFEVEETGSNMALYKGYNFGLIFVDFAWKEFKKNSVNCEYDS